MIQEKATSLRILQSNKKKNLSPLLYVMIGFIAGVVTSCLFVFLSFKSWSLKENTQIASPESATPSEIITSNAQYTEQVTNNDQEANAVEDGSFTQPQGNDLNKFFQREPVPAPSANTAKPLSPFVKEQPAKPSQTLEANKRTEIKSQTTPSTSHAQKTIKTDVKPSNSAEPDIENQTPEATVQIKVTQKPFAVNELK